MSQHLVRNTPITDANEVLWLLATENSSIEPPHLHYTDVGELIGWFVTIPGCREKHGRTSGWDDHYPVEPMVAHALIAEEKVSQFSKSGHLITSTADCVYMVTPEAKNEIWNLGRQMSDRAKELVRARFPELHPNGITVASFLSREHGLHGKWSFRIRTPDGIFTVFPEEDRIEE